MGFRPRPAASSSALPITRTCKKQQRSEKSKTVNSQFNKSSNFSSSHTSSPVRFVDSSPPSSPSKAKQRGSLTSRLCCRGGQLSKIVAAVGAKVVGPPNGWHPTQWASTESQSGGTNLRLFWSPFIAPMVPPWLWLIGISHSEETSLNSQVGVRFFTLPRSGAGSIVCLYFRYKGLRTLRGSGATFIVSHGNATDVGYVYSSMKDLCDELQADVVAYDYSGFGCSGGAHTERSLSTDIDAVYTAVTGQAVAGETIASVGSKSDLFARCAAKGKHSVEEEVRRGDEEVTACSAGRLGTPPRADPENVIVMGVSIGSVPSIRLAAKLSATKVDGRSEKRTRLLGGCVVQSGIMSAFNVLQKSAVVDPPKFDSFNNVERIASVTCPIYILHGTADQSVSVSHGRALAETAATNNPAVMTWWPTGGQHFHLEIEFKYRYY
eukprot:Selendium_serpulae@DN11569_c0_g1_i1.p1